MKIDSKLYFVSIPIQQLVGDNPDKEKIVAEYQNRLRGALNSKNVGLYVKSFMRLVSFSVFKGLLRTGGTAR